LRIRFKLSSAKDRTSSAAYWPQSDPDSID